MHTLIYRPSRRTEVSHFVLYLPFHLLEYACRTRVLLPQSSDGLSFLSGKFIYLPPPWPCSRLSSTSYFFLAFLRPCTKPTKRLDITFRTCSGDLASSPPPSFPLLATASASSRASFSSKICVVEVARLAGYPRLHPFHLPKTIYVWMSHIRTR